MMITVEKYIYIISSVLLIVVQLNAVTVNPNLCPTNKIAPHRRHADLEENGPRTFGLIQGLFGPSRRPQKPNPYNDLEEPPQEEDQEDCGEIDDYDETDLSSITPGGQKKKQNRNDRYFFGNNYVNSPHHHYPEQNQYPSPQHQNQYPSYENQNQYPSSQNQNQYPSSQNQNQYPSSQNQNQYPSSQHQNQYPSSQHQNQYPSSQHQNQYPSSQHQNQYPSSQHRPQRPPYNFEGDYGSNYYRPPSNHYPSNYVIPVQEDYQDSPQSAYRPGIIGGALGHIVGYPTFRPTTEDTIRRKQSNHVRFPNNDAHINRRRGRSQQSQQTHHSPNIIASFFDLFH